MGFIIAKLQIQFRLDNKIKKIDRNSSQRQACFEKKLFTQ